MRTRWPGPAMVAATLAVAACARPGFRLDPLTPAFSVGAVERFGHDTLVVHPGGEVVQFALDSAAEVALVAVTQDGRVRPLYPLAPGESSRFSAGPHALVVPVSYEWTGDPSAPARATAAMELEAMRAYRDCVARWRPRRTSGQRVPRSPGDTTAQVSAPVAEDGIVVREAEYCRPPAAGVAAGGGPMNLRPKRDIVVLVASTTALAADGLRERTLGVRVRSATDLVDLPRRVTGGDLRQAAGYYSVRFPAPRQQER